jgi:hypothetical protein
MYAVACVVFWRSAGQAKTWCSKEVVFTGGVASLRRIKDSVEEVRLLALFCTDVPTVVCRVCAKAAAIAELFGYF